MHDILAVILARGGSKGIPKKNIYPIGGYPLIAYSIAAASESKYITDLVVSTDSDEIARISKLYGANVPFTRPKELAGDTVLSVDALRHAVIETERLLNKTYDYVIELPCVAPLRDHRHIDEAIEKIIETKCDSVISMVSTGEKHPVRLKKIVDDRIVDFCSEYPEPSAGSRRQDLKPEAFIRNGAIYLMTRDTIVNAHSRNGKDSRPYIMSPEQSINIDEAIDIKILECFVHNGMCNNHPKQIKPKFLVTTPLHFFPEIEKSFNDVADCVFAPRAPEEQIIKIIGDVDVLVCQPCPEYVLGEDVLKHAKNIRIIASTSTGTNHIDKKYCNERGIKIISLKGSDAIDSITASSEFTFNLVLSVVRKTPFAYNNALQGLWRETEDSLRGIEINGKTMGIIGFGRIGSNNAKYANAFGMRIIAYDPNVNITEQYVDQKKRYEDVLSEADIVLICVHLDDTTYGMVDHTWFDAMKHGVYFINTSRGEIINEKALLENLKSGKISAAGLDVISNELTSDKNVHPIIKYAREHTNLIVTPHVAGLTYDSEKKAASIILSSIKKFLHMEH